MKRKKFNLELFFFSLIHFGRFSHNSITVKLAVPVFASLQYISDIMAELPRSLSAI